MRLKNVKMKNYRYFKNLSIDFDDCVTLIVGKNGAGKTAILDAVAVSVSTFLAGIDGGVSRTISKDDARYEFYSLNNAVENSLSFLCVSKALADGQPTDAGYRDKVLKASNSKSVALKYNNIIGMKRAERAALAEV
ncbi:MAG: ATP-binding protein [Lachnospiraceae bacterium]|nr:ATP-binding protein [Lachnospiraceae bacterium]